MWANRYLLHLFVGLNVFLLMFTMTHSLAIQGPHQCLKWCKSEEFYYCCKDDSKIPVNPGGCPPLPRECPSFAIRNLPDCRHDGECVTQKKCCFDPCEYGGAPICKLAIHK